MTPDIAAPAHDAADAASQAAAPADAPPIDGTVPPAPPLRRTIQKRVRAWIQVLHRDPPAEERASAERRARLLDEINRAVMDAPDDIPIKDLIARLNHHHDD